MSPKSSHRRGFFKDGKFHPIRPTKEAIEIARKMQAPISQDKQEDIKDETDKT